MNALYKCVKSKFNEKYQCDSFWRVGSHVRKKKKLFMRFKVRYQHHDISPEQWAMLLAVRLMQNFTFSPISQISEASWPSAWTWCQGWDSWRGRGHHCCPCLRSGEPSPWEREPREGTAYFATHSGWAGDPNRDAETDTGCAWCQHQDPSGYAAGERLRHNADCVIVFTALQ